MAYDRGHRTCEVICRCGKRVYTFTAWRDHLRAKHPKMYKDMRRDGTLEQDRLDFADARKRFTVG